MLADEVRLDLVNRTSMVRQARGGAVFGNYSRVRDWLLVPGFVDRQPAASCSIPTMRWEH